ncbi:hypothetical protein EDC04DRAFT_2605340 [Pisolithus marmoratus]|nr:hypothetical protein EDC04DRAFT_2605340 [Pisolithus marmoratus]
MGDSGPRFDATQWLSIWCSNSGSTALAIMAHFLSSGADNSPSPDVVWETCNELLDGLSFLFQDLDPTKLENACQSHFLLQLLAHTHLQPCVGCPDVPRLDTNALKEHGIKGAISLCCAMRGELHVDDQISTHGKATTRTPLKFNKVSGKESSATLAFSKQNWGSCPTMDSAMLEDGSFLDEVVTDDLAVSNHCNVSITPYDLLN